MHMNVTKQSGAALFMCLMLLLVMTLIGVSGITSSTLEEKMAGNMRNKHMSFQAAEAALRIAEIEAAALAIDTDFAATGDHLYERTDFIWETAADWQVYGLNAIMDPDNDNVPPRFAQDPSYIIENYSTSPRDDSCMLEMPIKPGCLLPVFRLTARGTGLNVNAISIIQSTYKQL